MIDHLIQNVPPAWYIPAGILITLEYTVIAVSIGLVLGAFLTLFKISNNKGLKFFASAYTSVFRGTPLLVQLSIVYFALPAATGWKVSAFAAGITAFSMNSAAYISETMRAGIQAVDKGQFEAARALGLGYAPMMRDIILPQAVRNILPSLVNEFVDMIKETAIISTIGVADLMRRAQIVAAQEYSYMKPLLIAALCYYVLVLVLSAAAKMLERKLKLA